MEEKKQRIQNLLSRLDELQSNSGKKARIRELLGRLEDLTQEKKEKQERTKEVVQIVNPKVEQIFSKLDEARNENASKLQEASQGFLKEINAIREILNAPKEEGPTLEQISELEGRIDTLVSTFEKKQEDVLNSDLLLQSEVSLVKQRLEALASLPDTLSAQAKDIEKAQQTAEDTQEAVEALERRVTDRISQIANRGGGNANRQILVNGSQSTLGYFTDINLIPGSNMGIAVGVDQTNKRTDFTIFGIPEGSGSVAAAGQNTQVQFNDNSFLGASAAFTWNNSTSVLSAGTSTNPSVFSVDGPSSVATVSGGLVVQGDFRQLTLGGPSAQAGGVQFRRGNGAATGFVGWNGASENSIFVVSNTSGGGEMRVGGTSSNGITTLYSNNVEMMRLTGSTVGIGITTPGTYLHIRGANGAVPTVNDGTSNLVLESTATAAVNVGPSLRFKGATGNGVTPYSFGTIQGAKGSAGVNDYSGDMVFSTTTSVGANTERMRISGAGNLSLGFTSTSNKFAVSGNMSIGANYNVAAPTNGFIVEGNTGIGTTSPNSALHVAGGFAVPIKSVSSTYTVLATDYTLLCNASTLGAFTVNLPTASVINGRMYVVKKVDDTVNAVTIDGSGGQTIDGAGTASIVTQYQAITIQSDGTNWHVLSNNN